ncbi:DUF1090 domain-containing protein [Pseudomonas sp. SST3]|uniref:DUF1090 domain-containing protein n=1 Tax=Pseudomonas sp. SST3 TaxID=2267882 RepID=UPI000DF9FFDC|nr:DUF1090 domain-containing protein [Pseudomonas sp. SST3]NKQ09573.1 DUF1090 domain-containing protein [Pseudomonas sp. SST3]
MKHLITLSFLALTCGAAQAADSCAAKEQQIQRQLEFAREEGNSGRIRGLETALSKVREYCTDAGLRAERREDIAEAHEEIRERKADLQEALRDGDQKKIEKRRRKLAEAQEELREVLAD